MRTFRKKMIHLLRKTNVRYRLLSVLLIGSSFSLVVTLIIGMLFAEDIANNYISSYLQVEQRRAAKSLELYIEEVILISLQYKRNAEVYQIAQDDTLGVADKQNMLQEAVSAIGSGKAQTVSNVYLIANDQTCYPLHTTAFLSSAIDLSFLKEVCGQPFSRTGGIVYDIEYNAYIPIGMEYRNYYTGESIGYLVMLLPERSMRGLFSGLLTTEGTTFLADTDGEIFENSAGSPPNLSSISYSTDIADTEQSSIKIATYKKEQYVIVTTNLSKNTFNIGFPWRIVSIIPYKKAFYVLKQVQMALFAAAAVAILISFLVSLAISNRLTQPLRRLQSRMCQLGKGKLDSYVRTRPNDELWELEQGYNDMVLRINELIEKNLEEQEKKREMEFIALQTQINPHFLYNTLDAIAWLAKLKGQK